MMAMVEAMDVAKAMGASGEAAQRPIKRLARIKHGIEDWRSAFPNGGAA